MFVVANTTKAYNVSSTWSPQFAAIIGSNLEHHEFVFIANVCIEPSKQLYCTVLFLQYRLMLIFFYYTVLFLLLLMMSN